MTTLPLVVCVMRFAAWDRNFLPRSGGAARVVVVGVGCGVLAGLAGNLGLVPVPRAAAHALEHIVGELDVLLLVQHFRIRALLLLRDGFPSLWG